MGAAGVVSAPIATAALWAGFVPWWDSWGCLGGCGRWCQVLACPSGGCGKLAEQVSSLPDGCAAVEVAMGLVGWVLQSVLSQLESPCTCRRASHELSSFPQRVFC